MSNKAALLTAHKARPLEIRNVDIPKPQPDQVVIRVRAAAINPVDFGIQAMGIIVEEFPSGMGMDMAGEISAVGSDVEDFKVGDPVLGCSDCGPEWKSLTGTFQHYAITHHRLVAKIPHTLPYTDATVLPIGMATAATALFDKRCMGLSLPHMNAKKTGSTLLVWGAASSVGSCAVQLARGAGYDVITTSSKKNLGYCRDLGAQEAFDYSSSSIVDDIVKYLEGKQSAGVFDAVMPPESISASIEIARRSDGHKHVGTVFPPGMPLPQALPDDVVVSSNYCTWIKENEVGEAVFTRWVSTALASGDLKCKPDAHIVGKGLDKVQDAIDQIGKGVSCTKLVVEMD